MHATMIAIATAAKIIAKGLARPRRRLSSPGSANGPLPIRELTTTAVIVQRPIDLTNAIVHLTRRGGVYHGTTARILDRTPVKALALNNACGGFRPSQRTTRKLSKLRSLSGMPDLVRQQGVQGQVWPITQGPCRMSHS